MATERITTDVTRRLDLLHWSRFHTMATAVLGIGWLLDAFEVNIVGSVLGVIQSVFHLDANQAAWVVSIWLIGIMFGAFIFGYLADRFGRKRLFLVTLIMYSICTLLTALSPTYLFLMIFRFLTAIGVGAEYAAINSAISEFIPPKNRGKVNALVMNFWPVGAMLAALVNLFFINLFAANFGWRIGFAVGAIAALFIAWMRRSLPESPRWLLAKGRQREAESVVKQVEALAGQTNTSDVSSIVVDSTPPQPFFRQIAELITRYPGRITLGCILDLSEAFGYYGMFAFLALVVLPAVNIPATQIPWFYFLGNVGALAGGLSMVMVIDRLGRKITVPSFYVLAALTAVLLAPATASHSGLIVLLAFMLANFFATGAWTSAYPTFSEIFPTHLRSTGIGLSVAVGRIGAALSAPLLVWIAQGSTGIPGALVTLAILWLVGAAAMIPWYFRGVEGANTPLENMVPHSAGIAIE
ncbi:MAG TPA: MFS transporter [Ktedonobacteraceae bacterium]|nr:MFS transporter [Ktedonobacteraceae bacterium]